MEDKELIKAEKKAAQQADKLAKNDERARIRAERRKGLGKRLNFFFVALLIMFGLVIIRRPKMMKTF